MTKRPRPYIVQQPGPLVKIDDNLWTISDYVPGIPGKTFPRTLHIIRLSDGRLLFHNAIPLGDAQLAEVAQLGKPAILFVPSPFHCIDAQAFADRLHLLVYCPAGVRKAVEERVRIDGDERQLADPSVTFVPIAGTRFGEGLLRVRSGERVSLVVCDLFLNVAHLGGFWGWVWKKTGFTGGPLIGPMWIKHAIADRQALKGFLLRLAEERDVVRVLPSHGPPITSGFAELFAQLAGGL